MKTFRVLTGQSRAPQSVRATWPRVVPWSFAETFREQAQRNHSQTLERLNERGGLAPVEIWLAAHGLRLFQSARQPPSETECAEWLAAAIANHDENRETE